MSKFDELLPKLKEVFQINQPDLDFGIYRIINQRADEIEDYLSSRLRQKVEKALASEGATAKAALEAKLEEAVENARKLDMDPDAVPAVQKIQEEIRQYGAASPDYENQVYTHLLKFFSRYYDKGDFISQRRYKGNTYAIPYDGEEVTLHWANKDQYYIKTSESFTNYAFTLSDGRSVRFEIVEADTARANNKDTKQERCFQLADQHDDTPFLAAQGRELSIRFTYAPSDEKQDALRTAAAEKILADSAVAKDWSELASLRPTEKNPERTLLEKHLKDYTTRNTSDYFIHKDLGGFLRRELDFYIKNEVMNLDDVQNVSAFQAIEKSLRMIQCLREIALDLIAFLAQIENFQKKLWLKKKFVVETHYCITLDRVPEALYSEINANEAQWQQWRELGLIVKTAGRDGSPSRPQGKSGKDGGLGETALPGFEENGVPEPETEAYLKAFPYLLVDTKLFPESFKWKLLQSIDEVDAKTDGVLVHSENFQALGLLAKRLTKKISCAYIDPPYNTDASPILYKNGYKTSTWNSLILNGLFRSKPLLKRDGIIVCAIDDEQQKELAHILKEVFAQNLLGTICVRSNPSGRPTKTGYAVSHEYLHIAGASQDAKIGRLPASPKQLERFSQLDEIGKFEWRNLRREGSNSDRSARRALFYPILVTKDTFRIPKMKWLEREEEWELLEEPSKDESIVYPLNDDKIEKTWRWSHTKVLNFSDDVAVRPDRSGKPFLYYKRRENEDGVVSISSWFDAKYSATEHGTAVLKDLFGTNSFSYPKSVHAVKDSIYIAGASIKNSLTLDYFAGSGTTGQAVIDLNRRFSGERKYTLIEMGEYFHTVLKPRIQKVVFSEDWKVGIPVPDAKANPKNPYNGVSHCFKYFSLESYEDTLNNLELKRSDEQLELLGSGDTDPELKEDYLLNYMLDVESDGSLLNVDAFQNPFDYRLKIATGSAGATEWRKIDLVETFNYLIGLTVDKYEAHRIDEGMLLVEGRLPDGARALVVWRDCEAYPYEKLTEFLQKKGVNPREMEFDVIYINGDHNLPNLQVGSEDDGEPVFKFKVRSTEQTFLEAMFQVEDV